MIRTQSAPGLGKGVNPLHGFTGDSQSLPLSAEEEEAERLYYALASCSLCKGSFQIQAQDLSRRSQFAGAHVPFLIFRAPRLPGIRGSSHPTTGHLLTTA